MTLHCPECGSVKIHKYGLKWRWRDNARKKVQQYICKKCGRVTTNPTKRD